MTRIHPEPIGYGPSHIISSNSLISLCLDRAVACALEDLFKWSPVLHTLEIKNLSSVPSVLLCAMPPDVFKHLPGNACSNKYQRVVPASTPLYDAACGNPACLDFAKQFVRWSLHSCALD